MFICALLSAGCGNGGVADLESAMTPEPSKELVLSCAPGAPQEVSKSSIRIGPVEFLRLAEFQKQEVVVQRGGAKMQFTVAADTATTIELHESRGAIGFVTPPEGVAFPPGAPKPLGSDAVFKLTVPPCPTQPGRRTLFAALVQVSRITCANFIVGVESGRRWRRTVSVGAGDRCRS